MAAGGNFFLGGGKQYPPTLGRVWSTYPIYGGQRFSWASPAASLTRRQLSLPLLSTGIVAACVSSLLLGGQLGLFFFWPIGKQVSDLLLIG